MSRSSRLKHRRQEKFKKHQIEVKEEKINEPRTIKGKEQWVEFTHAVYARRKLVGRTRSHRHALKLAHQHIRNTR